MLGHGPGPGRDRRRRSGGVCSSDRARGVGNSKACRIVGINRRTGTCWGYGREISSSSGVRMHYPAVINKAKRRAPAPSRTPNPTPSGANRPRLHLAGFVAQRLHQRWSRNWSARRCAASSPMTASGTWCTRRSIRRCNGRNWAGWSGSCPGVCCAPGGAGASHAVARTSVALGRWWA